VSRYELLVFLHVAAAIIWLGAGFMVVLLVYGAERARDRLRQLGYYRDVEWLSTRLFIPASLSVFILGVLLVLDGPWDFDEVWILFGLAGYAVSFGLGILYFKPEGERIGGIVERHGPEHPEIDRRAHRMNVIERVQLTILFLVVAAMTIKPTTDDTWTLVAGGAVLAAAIVLAASSLGRTSSRTAA
jgi:uncharacterized membrane protein